ncbi:hypothetical protein B8V81_0190 [Paenibacillus pasadenensis]|uniref:Uncharacterized protein n=1 Tax=Paenibacillus pasadenensis TaxID=217090 RepID=A0A2N5NCK8_9BACL|nr:hypothetical protein B8V81_0190 [Paenibacillus pasadenensis]
MNAKGREERRAFFSSFCRLEAVQRLPAGKVMVWASFLVSAPRE